MEYRIGFPIPVDGIYIEPLEKFASAFKEVFKRRKEEALSEPARTCEEIVLTTFQYLFNKSSLVDIQVSFFTKRLEILVANRIFHFLTLHAYLFYFTANMAIISEIRNIGHSGIWQSASTGLFKILRRFLHQTL